MGVESLRDRALNLLDSNSAAVGMDFTPAAPKHYKHAIHLWDTGYIGATRAEKGDPDGARRDIETLLATQNPETGFIPNMTFLGKGRRLDPERLLVFGPSSVSSDYSQPPNLAMAALRTFHSFSWIWAKLPRCWERRRTRRTSDYVRRKSSGKYLQR